MTRFGKMALSALILGGAALACAAPAAAHTSVGVSFGFGYPAYPDYPAYGYGYPCDYYGYYGPPPGCYPAYYGADFFFFRHNHFHHHFHDGFHGGGHFGGDRGGHFGGGFGGHGGGHFGGHH